jgi:hypothetical protein
MLVEMEPIFGIKLYEDNLRENGAVDAGVAAIKEGQRSLAKWPVGSRGAVVGL